MASDLVRTGGAFGELVLREVGDGHHEVISNGVFLMDTRDGRSERGLVELAVAALGEEAADLHVLLGGLGVGFSLGAALATASVRAVTVVEVEPAVVDLVRATTGARTGANLEDPRVELLVGDLYDVLASATTPVDVVCIDVDNGPGWVVGDGNRRLYDEHGLRLVRAALRPGGVCAIWSSHDDTAFVARLRRLVGPVRVHTFDVPRGEPDRVWVAQRPVD